MQAPEPYAVSVKQDFFISLKKRGEIVLKEVQKRGLFAVATIPPIVYVVYHAMMAIFYQAKELFTTNKEELSTQKAFHTKEAKSSIEDVCHRILGSISPDFGYEIITKKQADNGLLLPPAADANPPDINPSFATPAPLVPSQPSFWETASSWIEETFTAAHVILEGSTALDAFVGRLEEELVASARVLKEALRRSLPQPTYQQTVEQTIRNKARTISQSYVAKVNELKTQFNQAENKAEMLPSLKTALAEAKQQANASFASLLLPNLSESLLAEGQPLVESTITEVDQELTRQYPGLNAQFREDMQTVLSYSIVTDPEITAAVARCEEAIRQELGNLKKAIEAFNLFARSVQQIKERRIALIRALRVSHPNLEADFSIAIRTLLNGIQEQEYAPRSKLVISNLEKAQGANTAAVAHAIQNNTLFVPPAPSLFSRLFGS